MAEYENVIKSKPLRTLEIDVEKKIFKLNGDDIKKCERICVYIDAEKSEFSVIATSDITFEGESDGYQ